MPQRSRRDQPEPPLDEPPPAEPPPAGGAGPDDLEGIGPPDLSGTPMLRRMLLSWGPAAITPALWAFATVPERLGWTSQISSRLFSVFSPLYDEVTSVEGYGEVLEQALLDLRGTPSRILDMATGTGFAARRLKRQYPHAEVIGVDVSPEMVAI